MKKQSLPFLFCCVGLALSSCAVTHLKPGAENVFVTDGAHAPTDCKELGQVIAYDTNGSSVTYTSHERLQKYQLDTLRNKTVGLGGNVLSITNDQTTYADSHDKEPDLVDTHLMQGNVYRCSAAALKHIVTTDKPDSDLTPREEAEG